MTSIEISALTKKVNAELAPITAKFQPQVPLGDITNILVGNGLDPKAVQNGFQHNEEGRLHVTVGQGIFLTMTWYKFESTGRYEIVAYVSSIHDDVKTPAKPMDSAQKRKAIASVNHALETTNRTYWQGLGQACKAVSDALEQVGFSAHDFDQQTLHSTAGRNEGRIHAPVGNGAYVSFQWFRMGSGRYEITAYVS